MSDDHRGRFTQGRHQANHVSDRLTHVVGFNGVRPIALPESPLIGDDDPIAGLGQRPDLAPPHVPKVRKPMQQNDERALPLVDVVHANAVDFGKAVVECVGIVGIQLPQCGARLTECIAALVSIVYSTIFLKLLSLSRSSPNRLIMDPLLKKGVLRLDEVHHRAVRTRLPAPRTRADTQAQASGASLLICSYAGPHLLAAAQAQIGDINDSNRRNQRQHFKSQAQAPAIIRPSVRQHSIKVELSTPAIGPNSATSAWLMPPRILTSLPKSGRCG